MNKLKDCNPALIELHKRINSRLEVIYNKPFIITSGKRLVNEDSYHFYGLAMDGVMPESNIIYWIFPLLTMIVNFRFNNFKVVECIIYRKDDGNGKIKEHLHLAVDDTPGKKLRFLTGVYT